MRSRNVKPGLFKNEDLAEMGSDTMILFEGLWCLADREGRLEDRPKRIKAEVFPYREPDPGVDEALSRLCQGGFINRYEVGGNRYIHVINFLKHQNPHPRESKSIIPAPYEKDIPGHGQGVAEEVPRTDQGDSCKSGLPSDVLIPDSLNPDVLIPDVQGGAGETAEEEDSPPFDSVRPAEPEKPKDELLEKPENEEPRRESAPAGDRWTEHQDNKLNGLLSEIKQRYGQGFFEKCNGAVKTAYSKTNPEAILYCLQRIISERMAGKPIYDPQGWLKKAFHDQDGKHNAREHEARTARLNSIPVDEQVSRLAGGIGRQLDA